MKRRTAASALATLVAGAALALLPAQAAQAHPLGNFTVNQYDGLVVAPGKLGVDHVEDLAEIPAAQEHNRIDADGDDWLASAELSAWARARCDAAAKGARLTVAGGASLGGKTAAVSRGSAEAQVRPGEAGLQTLRVTCELTAPLPLPRDERMRVTYHPASVTAGAGWREITARGDRMTLSGADVPGNSVSRRLTVYPSDSLFTPPEFRSAAFTIRTGGPAEAGSRDEESGSPAAGVLPRGVDRWAQALTGLVARHELAGGLVPSPSAVVVLVGAAALGQAWFGFLLVLAYGVGLALTLAGAGLAAVRLKETVSRRLTRRRSRGRVLSRARRAAPLGTAAVVFVLGCGLLLRGAATALS